MIVISFDSTNYAMMAEKCFEENNFEKMIIPTPRAISNSCGISIMIDSSKIYDAKKLIQEKNLTIKGIYEVQGNNCTKL